MALERNINLTAERMAKGFATGQLCPVQNAEACLDKIFASDPSIFCLVCPDKALEAAHHSSLRWKNAEPLSIFDGVPIGWKDLFDIKGQVTTAGSIVRRPCPPASNNADIVNFAERAGLVSIGRLNMTEFAYSGLGLNPHYGTPINPHSDSTPRIPGGSSSGCGAAVASGLIPLAIGSDTGGSIRIPAALNGIVGYKGSSSAFSAKGAFALSRSVDTFGPLAHSVTDSIAAAQILSGRGVKMPTPAPIDGMSIIVPTNIVFDGLDDAVAANFEAAIAALKARGAQVEQAALPEFDEIRALSRHGYLVGAEALDVHWDLIHSDAVSKLDPRILARIREAMAMSARDLVVIQRARQRLIQSTRQKLGRQIVAYPTTAIVAPALAPLEVDDDLYLRTNQLMLRNTALGNFLDWCGVALPSGTDPDGLPTSILFSMPSGLDDTLLASLLSIEALLSPNRQ